MTNHEHAHHVSPEPVIHHTKTGDACKHIKENGSKFSVPVAIIIAGLLIASSIVLTNNGGVKIGSSTAVAGAVEDENLTIREDDHVFGNKKADVVLFEWSDPECPFCKRHHETTTQLLKKYEGKIAIVYRHFALDFHEYAKKDAESMECAAKVGGEESFKAYADKLFETTEGNNSLKREDLTKIATAVGLDIAKFDACVDSGEMEARVQKDIESGIAAGVMGTPYTIAVNMKTGRQREINGAQPIEMISATLAQLLK